MTGDEDGDDTTRVREWAAVRRAHGETNRGVRRQGSNAAGQGGG
jgi:hypothetical protein